MAMLQVSCSKLELGPEPSPALSTRALHTRRAQEALRPSRIFGEEPFPIFSLLGEGPISYRTSPKAFMSTARNVRAIGRAYFVGAFTIVPYSLVAPLANVTRMR